MNTRENKPDENSRSFVYEDGQAIQPPKNLLELCEFADRMGVSEAEKRVVIAEYTLAALASLRS